MHTSILHTHGSPVVSAPVAKAFASSCSKLANNSHVVNLLTHRAGHSYGLHHYYICLVKNACITHAQNIFANTVFPSFF